MVAKRNGFQKVYDLAERELPLTVNTTLPTSKEYAGYLITNAIRANGIVEQNEIGYLQKKLKGDISKVIKKMLTDGDLISIEIAEQKNKMYLSTPAIIKNITATNEKKIHVLSPFDNFLIQRKRIRQLFDFDYKIECYVPESKRKYGYFCLPVLCSNIFVARFDSKADRANKTFYIKHMHFEKNFKPKPEFNTIFADKLKAFATFNGCSKIVIDKAVSSWKKEMKSILK